MLCAALILQPQTTSASALKNVGNHASVMAHLPAVAFEKDHRRRVGDDRNLHVPRGQLPMYRNGPHLDRNSVV